MADRVRAVRWAALHCRPSLGWRAGSRRTRGGRAHTQEDRANYTHTQEDRAIVIDNHNQNSISNYTNILDGMTNLSHK